jgi:signal peptidase II
MLVFLQAKKYNFILSPGFFLVSLIFIDQFSKYVVRSQELSYICNSGISFGFKISPVLFYFCWFFITSGLIYVLFKKQRLYSYAILLVLAGAFSNLIDRFCFGCVVDFIDFKFWPVFNFADSFIFFGALILAIQINLKK